MFTVLGHGLKIISRVMNSPFDALTVFTKFISSPTDALEIISKVVNSPEDVLQFIKNLMETPENGIDIMNKFMNSPAEALRLINQLFTATNDSSSPIIPETGVLVNNSSTESNQWKGAHCLCQTTNTTSGVGFSDNVEIISQDNLSQKINSMNNERNNVKENIAGMNNFNQSKTVSNQHNDFNQKNRTQEEQQIKNGHFSPFKAKRATVATRPDLVITFVSESDDMPAFRRKPIPPIPSPQIVLTPITSAEDMKKISSHKNIMLPPETVITPLTSTGKIVQVEQKVNIKKSSMHSPIGNTPPSLPVNHVTKTEDFCYETFDVKAFMQNTITEKAIYGPRNVDGKSLESVLSEVIRIEYQACNDLSIPIKLKNYTNTYVSGNNIPNIAKSEQNVNESSTKPHIISRQLNDIELIKLRELKVASEALYLPVDVDLSDLMCDDRIRVSNILGVIRFDVK